MKPVREVVSREIIDDLWGAGYTILPRARHPDPFHMPAEMVPQGRSYQWWHLIHDKFHFERPKDAVPSGWAPVPASRHDGYFMPAGFVGDIEVNGLGLFEKPKFEVDQERAANTAAAHKAVDDWKAKWGGWFSGDVSVNGERTEIGETKTIENTTAIPKDMVPYIAQIFEERDRLLAEWRPGTANSDINAIALANDAKGLATATAIDNIRKRIKQEASNGD